MNTSASSAVPAPTPSSARTPSYLLLAVTVLVVAANLRGAITALGPIIDRVGTDTGLSAGALGVLGALPILTFGVVSPLVHRLSSTFGADRAVFGALLVLTLGTVVRSLPGLSGWLWVGTVLLAAAIAVANVLMPAIVKRDFPQQVSLMTGLYSAVMSGFAAIASGIAVPIARSTNWELALGVWAIPALIAAGVWVFRLRGSQAARPVPIPATTAPTAARSMWRSGVAWQVALVMALQSSVFYLLITWLPSIESSHGVGESEAGWHLVIFQIAGIVGGLVAGPVLHRRHDQSGVGMATAGLMVIAMVGLLVLPDLVVVWVAFAGLSAGSSLVVALTLMSVRARTPHDSGRLSAMSQSVGYLIASLGPIMSGLLFEFTDSWTPVLVFAALLATGQGAFVAFAGRNRFAHAE
ncbi:MFS transporter [Demequina aurantiaca]|uniref:MFS transporter n=1 Tax=Demequina aurantiaca TaxID=676200 RepID=UPI000A011AA3|nr:MFS transporter [Demequina aurantiaca]